MSNNNDLDPAASTQMFRAFVEGGNPNTPTPAGRTTAKSGSGGTGKLIGAIVVIAVIAVVAFVALH